MTDARDTQLMVLDALQRQGRLNEAVASVLYALSVSFDKADERHSDHNEDIGALSVEVARINARIESLTATVGRLMQKVEPNPTELHSVKVDDDAH